MSGEYGVNSDMAELAELLGNKIAGAQALALQELSDSLRPAKKVRSEAAQRVVFRTIALEDGTVQANPTAILGRGITENRARVTLWCNTGGVVFISNTRGAVQNSDTRIQLVPLVPIVLLDASELFALSAAAADTITMIVEEYDA